MMHWCLETAAGVAAPAAGCATGILQTFLEHIHEEEHTMLPALRDVLQEAQLRELGKRFEAAKQRQSAARSEGTVSAHLLLSCFSWLPAWLLTPKKHGTCSRSGWCAVDLVVCFLFCSNNLRLHHRCQAISLLVLYIQALCLFSTYNVSWFVHSLPAPVVCVLCACACADPTPT